MQRFLVVVYILDKTFYTALVAHIVDYGLLASFVCKRYAHSGIEKRLFAKPFQKSIVFKFKSFKYLRVGEESDFRSRFIRAFKFFYGRIGFSALIFLEKMFMASRIVNIDRQPLGKSVNLISAAAEFAAGVKDRENDFNG